MANEAQGALSAAGLRSHEVEITNWLSPPP
jgi:hypothetical protein